MAINTALDPAALELIDSIRSGKALSLFKPASDQPADEIAQSAYLARLLRQDIHQQPELAFEEHRTSAIVATMLRMWGYEVHEGVGRTGVVAVMHFVAKAKDPADLGPGFGFRADMDALPIQEQTGKAYASRRAGFMHACGHDGHTASLLGAARLIAQRKAQAACENWHGRLHLIFQPAEENGQDGGGAMAMVRDGLFERFPCEQIFGMHNAPTLGLGKVHLRPGPMMASSDRVDVLIEGKGGHAAFPHRSVDPTVAAASVVMALQSIVSRNVDPFANAVISIGKLIAGERGTHNVIPQQARLELSVRALDPTTRDLLESRIRRLIELQCESFGCSAGVDYRRGYPVLVNHPASAALVEQVARECFGDDMVDGQTAAIAGSEDFASMLEVRPGCYFLMGNGDSPGSCMVHHPGYDFNDDLLPASIRMWTALAQKLLALA
ncbi:MAG: amidohydrolase [Betaproteobacteria bacterium]|nr:amidohydrolase [Betaproteobacteria bacterium]NDA21703.1 amidohydrolase [Betaproteobacteria bacterium]NDD75807.1 amidohydrolase [Betaproteobacteria bacterium]NDF75766.1 amidohydrolase [Betaproteobacteria bacterium]NDI22547.1 amidohydrolase [Betaproteobacteria bacterium]